MILEFIGLYKKERINYKAELESNKIEYKKIIRDLKEKKKIALESAKTREDRKEINVFFKKELKNSKVRYKDTKVQAKINFMSSVARNKELKENVKLTKKSKSNLHQILYTYAKLPYEEKKNSLVVQEISPSRELKFEIKKRVFNDLNAFNDSSNDRVYAGEKDILFTNIKLENGNEKIPIVLRYSGECVPVFLEKIRDDTFDKFSTENEHHIMLLSERLREIKAPGKGLKIGKKAGMIIIASILIIGYLAYKYYNGGL